jgi:Zn-dependent peptidase ImmA (M78 family)
MSDTTGSLPSYAANAVLKEVGITSIEDLRHLELIAFQRGAVVRKARLKTAEARITVGRKRAVITISTAINNTRRQRFSIAHELGHLELHRYDRPLSPCFAEDLNDWAAKSSKRSFEQEANEFAGSLLLPEEFFAPLCQDQLPSMEHIIDLSDEFDVSLTATGWRYTQFCPEPVAIVWSENDWIRWFRGSKEFEELGVFVDVQSPFSQNTVASQFFDKGVLSLESQQPVKASAWFREGGYGAEARVKEQSLAMPKYNGVLTLLWVDEELSEDDDLWL